MANLAYYCFHPKSKVIGDLPKSPILETTQIHKARLGEQASFALGVSILGEKTGEKIMWLLATLKHTDLRGGCLLEGEGHIGMDASKLLQSADRELCMKPVKQAVGV